MKTLILCLLLAVGAASTPQEAVKQFNALLARRSYAEAQKLVARSSEYSRMGPSQFKQSTSYRPAEEHAQRYTVVSIARVADGTRDGKPLPNCKIVFYRIRTLDAFLGMRVVKEGKEWKVLPENPITYVTNDPKKLPASYEW